MNSIRNAVSIRTRSFAESELTPYLTDIKKYAVLSKSELIALAKLSRNGDKTARDRIVNANLRYVISVAKDFRRYHSYSLSLAELVFEGNVGLMYAVNGFDPDRNCCFTTYAKKWIYQSMQRYVYDRSTVIHVPQKHWNDVSYSFCSLDAPVKTSDNSEASLESLIADNRTEDSDRRIMIESARKEISNALSSIDPREAEIVRLCSGLRDSNEKTYVEVGKILSLTRERIRQLNNHALHMLSRNKRLRALYECNA